MFISSIAHLLPTVVNYYYCQGAHYKQTTLVWDVTGYIKKPAHPLC